MGREIMYNYNPGFFDEYQGDINVGDLVTIKEGMLLIEPGGPVVILEADNDKGIYEIMYTRNNYVMGCGRREIKNVISKAVESC